MTHLIYLVEDDIDILRLLRHSLEANGFSVTTFTSAFGVIESALRDSPSLLVLDIMLPGGDGFDLGRRIRQSPVLHSLPIIFLTAKTAENDRIRGLELGGDDYVTKPFSPREFVARIKAVLRRFERPLAKRVIEAGELHIDAGAMRVVVRGSPVVTTSTEFRLLEYLARHPGQVFTRDQLLDAVWRDTQFVTPRSIDVYVRKPREKIERAPNDPEYLVTIRGTGYRFEVPRSTIVDSLR